MSPSRRMILWGLAVSAGHVVLGLIGRLVLEVPGSPVFFGLCAALTMGIALAAAPLLRPRRRGDDGPGGGGGEGPPEPPPPPWWPEFEREFRAYAERKRRVGA